MARTIFWRALAALALAAFTLAGSAQQSKAPTTPRLYVFNGGELASETARYRLTDADVESVPLSVASFLIVHPRGVLLWDAAPSPTTSAAATSASSSGSCGATRQSAS